jgi:hypothetical protein
MEQTIMKRFFSAFITTKGFNVIDKEKEIASNIEKVRIASKEIAAARNEAAINLKKVLLAKADQAAANMKACLARSEEAAAVRASLIVRLECVAPRLEAADTTEKAWFAQCESTASRKTVRVTVSKAVSIKKEIRNMRKQVSDFEKAEKAAKKALLSESKNPLLPSEKDVFLVEPHSS